MKKTTMTWNTAKDKVLWDCAISGDTQIGAARRLNTTVYHVKKRADELGIAFVTKRLSEQGKEFIREHFGRGMTPTEIAKAIGFTTSTVYYWAVKYGLFVPNTVEDEDAKDRTGSTPAWRTRKEFWQFFDGLTDVDLDKELLVKAALRTIVEMLSDFGRGVFLDLSRGKSVKLEKLALFKHECFWLDIPFFEVVCAGIRHRDFLRRELC